MQALLLPTFEDTTHRWAGSSPACMAGQGASTVENKQVADGVRPVPGPPPSFWPDWNWTGNESTNSDEMQVEILVEYAGSDSSNEEKQPITPTYPAPRLPEAASKSPPRSVSSHEDTEEQQQRTPTKYRIKAKPVPQRIPGQSHSKTASEQSDSDEEEAAATMEDRGYSSLEHVRTLSYPVSWVNHR